MSQVLGPTGPTYQLLLDGVVSGLSQQLAVLDKLDLRLCQAEDLFNEANPSPPSISDLVQVWKRTYRVLGEIAWIGSSASDSWDHVPSAIFETMERVLELTRWHRQFWVAFAVACDDLLERSDLDGKINPITEERASDLLRRIAREARDVIAKLEQEMQNSIATIARLQTPNTQPNGGDIEGQ